MTAPYVTEENLSSGNMRKDTVEHEAKMCAQISLDIYGVTSYICAHMRYIKPRHQVKPKLFAKTTDTPADVAELVDVSLTRPPHHPRCTCAQCTAKPWPIASQTTPTD